MKLTLLLASEDQAEVRSLDGDRVQLQSTRPFPPGSLLVGSSTDGSGTYRVKVKGSRRIAARPGDGFHEFLVEGRFVNLTRPQRARLRTPG